MCCIYICNFICDVRRSRGNARNSISTRENALRPSQATGNTILAAPDSKRKNIYIQQ